VHSFEGQALESFRAAKQIGAITLLDVNNAFEFAAAELEAEGLGLPSSSRLARVRAERELADYLLAPSEYVARCLNDHGVERERILLLPLGTAIADEDPQMDAASDEKFRAFFCGHLGARKGLRYLLDGWREADISGGELILVGGADSYGRKLLRNLPPNVRAPGYVPWPSLQAWFSFTDVFVFPSLAEGSALVIYQAMASGLPVITTPNAGSVVRDGVDGFVVPPRDVEAVAERLRLLAADSDLRTRMGANAAQRIRDGFTWTHYGERLRAIYESIASGGVPKGLRW
jgi:glycosyltransferase involved in cell wall biosynthesis